MTEDAEKPLRIRIWRRHEHVVTIEHTRDFLPVAAEEDRVHAAVHAYSRTLAGVGADGIASELYEALRTVIDWADFALKNPQEFDSHGVRNLDGPAFDTAREVLAKVEVEHLAAEPSCAANHHKYVGKCPYCHARLPGIDPPSA